MLQGSMQRRESEGRAAAQPPGASARTQKVAWRRCCRVQIAAPRCPRRSPARLGHRSHRPNKQQRKTGSYTGALPVASSWPPHRRRQLRSHLSRHRARPCCRRIKEDMILSQPGASSAEPSGLLPGPCTHRRSWPPPATGAREGEEVIGLHHASIPSASPNENDVALSRHCAGCHPHQPGRCAGGRLSCLCAPRRRAERRVNMLPTPLRAHS